MYLMPASLCGSWPLEPTTRHQAAAGSALQHADSRFHSSAASAQAIHFYHVSLGGPQFHSQAH